MKRWTMSLPVCQRVGLDQVSNRKAKSLDPKCNNSATEFTRLDHFETIFMKVFVMTVIVPQTNKHLVGVALACGEFLRWIGVWLLTCATR